MWEVEAVYSCFIPQDYTSLNTDKDTLYITPLGPPQAREALSNVTMNKFLVSSLFFPRKLFTLAAVANPVGPSLVRTVAHIIIRNMQRRIRERPSNVALRVAVPPPPCTRQSCSRHKIRTTPLIMSIAVSLKHTERTFHNMFN